MNFLIIYSRGKWVTDVFLGNFPCWSLFNLRARFLLFWNEKSQKLNLNNLKSKRPLAARENEAAWQKTRKIVLCYCCRWCVCRRVMPDISADFVCHCMFCSMQCAPYDLRLCEKRCFCTSHAYMDAHVCFVLDPLSSNVSLTLAKRQLPLQFSRSLILMAGPLWDRVGACGDRWMRSHTHITHTLPAHIHIL